MSFALQPVLVRCSCCRVRYLQEPGISELPEAIGESAFQLSQEKGVLQSPKVALANYIFWTLCLPRLLLIQRQLTFQCHAIPSDQSLQCVGSSGQIHSTELAPIPVTWGIFPTPLCAVLKIRVQHSVTNIIQRGLEEGEGGKDRKDNLVHCSIFFSNRVC